MLKLLNKLGYYKLNQLKVGGMCGLCGERLPKLIWVDTGSKMWDGIGMCDVCSGHTCPHGEDWDDCPDCRH